nr:uncharacterized protein LOC133617081 isoform X3 [Nerophis lumbriciformis]
MCERTIAEYKEELSPTKEETERHRQVCVVFKEPNMLHRADIQQIIRCQEESLSLSHRGSFPLKLEDPQPLHFKVEKEDPQYHHVKGEEEDSQPLHIKQEEEELWVREGVCLLGQLTVKTDDHEDEPPESSQLHHSPSKHNMQMSSNTTFGTHFHTGSTQQPNNIKMEEEEPHTPSFKEEPIPHVKEEEEEPPTHFKDEVVCWGSSTSKRDLNRIDKLTRKAGQTIGT